MGMQMKRLREHRAAQGLSRRALAEKAGVSAELIKQHEYGWARDTHVSVAFPLAWALGVRIDELYAEEDMALRVKAQGGAA